ncbi:MAG: MSCRAMM family protein [Candidatus Thorarchaeota archaeon]
MSRTSRAVAFVILTLVLAGTLSPVFLIHDRTVVVRPIERHQAPAATVLNVEIQVFNNLQEFNDDDFRFKVLNGTYEVRDANVSLYNKTSGELYASKLTIGDGTAVFIDVPAGTYIWNVTWAAAPGVYKTGEIVSDGPDVTVNWEVGNLDGQNNDDDFYATVVDISDNPAKGLNFSIHFRSNNSIYTQTILGEDGVANFTDIPDGNYTWKVTVVSGTYAGVVVAEGNFTCDGTPALVHTIIGPFFGDPDYYDLEVFVYYEGTEDPVQGALVNLTYYNGTEIESKTTSANGTVLFLDLPVAAINWTVTFGSPPEVIAEGFRNLTLASADVRDPVILGPGDVEFLVDTPNATITWHVEDEHPHQIRTYVNGDLTDMKTWTNSSYDYVFNVTGFALGTYDVRVVAEDEAGNTASDEIKVRIYENITPVIAGPDDMEFLFSETGHYLRWNITEDHPDKYVITRDGEVAASGPINPLTSQVSISLDGLNVGSHLFVITVNDTSGNAAQDNVTVTVLGDTTPPVFTYTPPTITYFRGDTNKRYNWTAEDKFKSNYTIEVDGFVVVEADWTEENIWFDFSGLSEGEHVVVLTVRDIAGNEVSSAVRVIVYPPFLLLLGMTIGGTIFAAIVVIAVYSYFKTR